MAFLSFLHLSVVLSLSQDSAYQIGDFQVSIINDPEYTFQLSVYYKQQFSNPVFSLGTGSSELPFIQIASATLSQQPISSGNYKNFLHSQQYHYKSSALSVDDITQNPDNKQLVISGLLDDKISYSFTLSKPSPDYPYYDEPDKTIQSKQSLDFNVIINPKNETLDISINRILLRYDCDPAEAFMGFGQQYSFINFRGKVVPIIISEQGVGRGLEPVTFALNELGDGAGGDWHTSYGSKPLYITNMNRSFALTNYEITVFELRNYDFVEVEVYTNDTNAIFGRIAYGATPHDLISEMTLLCGRQKPLPSWLLKGGILGIEGGQDYVYKTTASLIEQTKVNKPALIGLWLQDWSGSAEFPASGTRLLWNWELNTAQYPDWNGMFSNLSSLYGDQIRSFSYINPYFANVSYLSPNGFRHNYFEEGVENDYFIKNSSNLPYLIDSINIDFATVDLTNEAAVKWITNIIQQNMITDTQISGFMADFGEYIPFDAVFSDESVKASFFHNEYAQKWAEVVRNAVNEMSADNEVIPWHRSSALRSPKYARSFWFGDQLVSWDSHDGLESVMYALFSANIMGHTLGHSDIGGYTMLDVHQYGFELFNYTRSEELLLRWMELSAFSDMIYRSHPGNIPNTSSQIYSNNRTIAQFVQFSNVFRNLSDYKMRLMNDSYNYGLPIVRHLFFDYPNDENVRRVIEEVKFLDNDFVHRDDDYVVINQQFLLGDCLIMAPALYPNISKRRVYLPKGRWRSYWNEQSVYESKGQFYEDVSCVIGQPPVFVCDDWNYSFGDSLVDL